MKYLVRISTIIIIINIILFITLSNISLAAAQTKVSVVTKNLEKTKKTYPTFFNHLANDVSKNRWTIPGLSKDDGMVPQGLCKTEKYTIISSYASENKNKNSRLIILDSNGKKIRTVKLTNDKSHVGGLAYDGKNVFVCDYDGIIKIPLSEIEKVINNGKPSNNGIDIKKLTRIKLSNNKGKSIEHASFSTYDTKNNILWVGTYRRKNEPTPYLYGYTLDKNKEKASLKYQIKIPRQIQGMTILSDGRVLLTQTHGSSATKILIYNKDKLLNKKNLENNDSVLKAPPAGEGLAVDKYDRVYIIFESAAYRYLNNNVKNRMDHVCILKDI